MYALRSLLVGKIFEEPKSIRRAEKVSEEPKSIRRTEKCQRMSEKNPKIWKNSEYQKKKLLYCLFKKIHSDSNLGFQVEAVWKNHMVNRQALTSEHHF